MTFDPKPLLKGFGAAADVAGQIATDKAVNSRRTRSGFIQFDITNGQLIRDERLLGSGSPLAEPSVIDHGLGREPTGVIILEPNPGTAVCVSVTSSTVTVSGTLGELVTMWVV
jgi:hypothetical protein